MASTSAFKKLARELTEELRQAGRKEKVNPLSLANLFKTFSGRCAYCGVPCVPNSGDTRTKVSFQWYIPLNRGGLPEKENLVPVCSEHRHKYRASKRQIETIPDVNTFGDLMYSLIQATVTMTRLKSDNNTEAFVWEHKINRIKRAINSLLEEMMVSTQYRPFTDWKVDNMTVYEEDINTIPDMVEDMTEKEIAGEPAEKESLIEAAKQMLTTKQYKIIRK